MTQIEKYKSPTGDGNAVSLIPSISNSLLRNISPRQGTETQLTVFLTHQFLLRNISPRQGTETYFCVCFLASLTTIEKYKSPTGDGNISFHLSQSTSPALRNISPRQGTETVFCHPSLEGGTFIEKYKSPTGDGNGESFLLSNLKTD